LRNAPQFGDAVIQKKIAVSGGEKERNSLPGVIEMAF
jgi:hypothetical protein